MKLETSCIRFEFVIDNRFKNQCHAEKVNVKYRIAYLHGGRVEIAAHIHSNSIANTLLCTHPCLAKIYRRQGIEARLHQKVILSYCKWFGLRQRAEIHLCKK